MDQLPRAFWRLILRPLGADTRRVLPSLKRRICKTLATGRTIGKTTFNVSEATGHDYHNVPEADATSLQLHFLVNIGNILLKAKQAVKDFVATSFRYKALDYGI